MCKITNEQIDTALLDALHMPASNDSERFSRTLSVANIVNWYISEQMFYPPLNAVDCDVFHECCRQAREIGLLR